MFQLGGEAGLQGAQLGYRERGKVDCRRPVSIGLVIHVGLLGSLCSVAYLCLGELRRKNRTLCVFVGVEE